MDKYTRKLVLCVLGILLFIIMVTIIVSPFWVIYVASLP